MIDLHIHILHGLDDGAADVSQAIEMAKVAVADGTKAVVGTVHSYAKRGFYELLPEDIAAAADELRHRLADEGIDLTVYTGMEVLLDLSVLPLLREGRLLTLGGTRWLLTEFYGGESQKEIESLLRAVLEMGYKPLVAHAERYKAFQKHPDFAALLCDMGCAIQVNAHSISGEADRKFVKTARRLCERRLVHIVASDGHNHTSRPPVLKSAGEWLAANYDESSADRLLKVNPAALLADCMPAELMG